jgi:hypothetical protein
MSPAHKGYIRRPNERIPRNELFGSADQSEKVPGERVAAFSAVSELSVDRVETLIR